MRRRKNTLLLTLSSLLIVKGVYAQATELSSLYAAKAYQACLEQAQASKRFDDLMTQTYLSLCAEETDHDTIAIAALERILFMRPDDVDAMLRLGSIYRRLGLIDQQTLLTDSLKAYELTPSQRTALTTLLSQKTPSLAKVSARVSLGGGYDSDLNILPTTDVIASPFMRFTASLSGVHELERTGGWSIHGSADYLHQSNEADHLYDIDYLDTRIGISYTYETSTLSLPLYYRRLDFLDEDLLQEYGVAPKLDMMLSSSTLLSLEVMIAKRDFLPDSYRPKDFDMLGGSLGGVWFFKRDFLYLKGMVKQFHQSNDLPDLFTAKETHTIMSGGRHRLGKTIAARVDYRYRNSQYHDYVRHDRNHAAMLSLEWILEAHWRLVGTYKYIVNLSDFDAAYYRKHVTGLALQYDY